MLGGRPVDFIYATSAGAATGWVTCGRCAGGALSLPLALPVMTVMVMLIIRMACVDGPAVLTAGCVAVLDKGIGPTWLIPFMFGINRSKR